MLRITTYAEQDEGDGTENRGKEYPPLNSCGIGVSQPIDRGDVYPEKAGHLLD